MNNPIIFERADYCPRCMRNTIEAFDYFNNRMGLKKAADMSFANMEVPDNYFKRDIFRLRCKSCGATYRIRWFRGCPYPIYGNELIKIFMLNYSQKE